ncbi:LIC20211 family lipoprotein [Leptospira sp. 'Mane']|uniref:LIC20211 family lipoprotein n=1 Tax=Leptospira sp. 'Mane' TaxID=3387407 RepID=UPI00398A8601
MKKTSLILGLFTSYLSFTHCASSSVGIAASNRPLSNIPYETVKSAEKTFRWYSFDIGIFGIPTSIPPADNVIQSLLEGEDADAVVNIRYWNDKSVFGPITRHRFGIKGDLVKFTVASTTPTKNKK